MNFKSTYLVSFLKIVFLVIFISSCVEEIPLETQGFEKILVIEGTITNEVKRQQIKLSETFAIEEDGPNPISGANVSVLGNTEYAFEEYEPGVYLSSDDFAAEPGVDYQLKLTVNGKDYESDPMQMPGSSRIDQLKAKRVDLNEENGIVITLNNETSAGDVNYYRYEYTETFKFNSNLRKVNTLIIENGEVVEVPKQKEEFTCYRTDESKDIILANTNLLSENNVKDLLITFINSDDPKLSNRYSINVKQYVISRATYSYYEVLEELSGSDNLFSQTQPGFFAGNISNLNNTEEKIIGFFDISTVSSKRLYFNYEDFYPMGSTRPRFVSVANCVEVSPTIPVLIEQIQLNQVRWSSTSPGGIISVVPRRCVDCTVFGTNERPEFWED